MKKFQNTFVKKLIRTSSSIAIGTAFLGLTTNIDPVKASTPAVCKDVLTQTTPNKIFFLKTIVQLLQN